MNIYKIPGSLKTLIFDIDSTLYTNEAYAFEQIDCQLREFARERNMPIADVRKMIADYRKDWSLKHDGKKISLGNTLTAFDVPIEKSVQWRRELMRPEDYLTKDETLIGILKELSKKYKLICVTNNPVAPAWKTLEALGIEQFFIDQDGKQLVVGLDTCYKSKPAREPFLTACEWTHSKPEECLSIGDRYDLDISLPLELGMGGILVTGVKNVYELPQILNKVSN